MRPREPNLLLFWLFPTLFVELQAALNGYQLDKAHKFAATLFDEVDRLAKVPEQYQEPEERTFTPGENLLVRRDLPSLSVGHRCSLASGAAAAAAAPSARGGGGGAAARRRPLAPPHRPQAAAAAGCVTCRPVVCLLRRRSG